VRRNEEGQDSEMNNQDTKQTLVLGVGNVLMGDEGVGVRAIEQLQRSPLPDGVELLDGGTGGFHLLSLFQQYDPLILIDATMNGAPAGTVAVTRPRFASDFPRTLSAHDIGLRDLLESAQLLGPLPRMYLVTVAIDCIQPMSLELSETVFRSLSVVGDVVRSLLHEVATSLPWSPASSWPA
jgi:hydrogenase maturation protease